MAEMILTELFQDVSFEGVKKELLLTNIYFNKVIDKFKTYFENLKEIELGSEYPENIIKMNREFFDTSIWVPKDKKDFLEELTTFIPAKTILSASVAEEDLKDLGKELIVAGALCLLTHNGQCFSEEERMLETERLKEHIQQVQESNKEVKK